MISLILVHPLIPVDLSDQLGANHYVNQDNILKKIDNSIVCSESVSFSSLIFPTA